MRVQELSLFRTLVATAERWLRQLLRTALQPDLSLPIRPPRLSSKRLEQVLRRIRAYPGVVIAQVGGSVWGGAVDLVMSCDMVVAARSASFAMTPAGKTHNHLNPRPVGAAAACDLLILFLGHLQHRQKIAGS